MSKYEKKLKKTKRQWELVIADNFDYAMADRISRFILDFNNKGRLRRAHSAEYYLWKIKENPAGPGFISLAIKGDRVIGTTTVTRKRIWFCGQLIDSAEIGDTFTDEEYQRQGIFTALVKATRDRAVESGVRLIYGTPNNNSLPGYERNCSFFRKSNLNCFLWIFPLKPGSVLGKKFGSGQTSLFHKAIDRIADIGLRTLTFPMPKEGKESELSFDSSFDDFNDLLNRKYTFMLSRGSSDLKFRLAENPESKKYGLIVKRSTQGDIKAYIVFKDSLQDGMKIFFIADFIGFDTLSMIQVWNKTVHLAMNRNYDLVAIWAPKRWSSFFRALPIPPLPVSRKDVIIYDLDLGQEVLHDEGHWLFSILDSDNI